MRSPPIRCCGARFAFVPAKATVGAGIRPGLKLTPSHLDMPNHVGPIGTQALVNSSLSLADAHNR